MYLDSRETTIPNNQSRIGTYQSTLKRKTPLRKPPKAPEYTEDERWYMVRVTSLSEFPKGIQRWKDTVAAMLGAFSIKLTEKLPAYVTVDHRHVRANCLHRRGGLHVDGNWIELWIDEVNHSSHGTEAGTYTYLKGICNKFPFIYKPETILLYTNVSGCVGYVGQFTGEIMDDGDCSQISTNNLERVTLCEHIIYAGNETFLHESIPVTEDCDRFVVRIVIPGLDISTLT